MAKGSIVINEGKDKINEGLKELPNVKKQLKEQKTDLMNKRDALVALIKNKEENNIPVTEEEREALKKNRRRNFKVK